MSVSTFPSTIDAERIATPIQSKGVAREQTPESVLVIDDYDRMPPFFCSLTSDADVWLFISSTGGMTAGRRDADEALLPYETVDKIHDGIAHTGPVALVRWHDSGGSLRCWEPFRSHGGTCVRRRISKTKSNTRITFEETLVGEDLVFTSTFMISPRFGVIRECRLCNQGTSSRTVEVLHGMRNLIPSGVTRQTQNEFSCLLDAYKQSELLERSGLGMFSLASGLTDLPKPHEVLRATVAWSGGLPIRGRSVDLAAVERFRSGASVEACLVSRGVRSNYLEWAALELSPCTEQRWILAMDTGLDQAAVGRLVALIESGNAVAEVDHDVDLGEQSLWRRLAASDAIQVTGDSHAATHHVANVLFNIMRGGTFPEGYRIRGEDFARFVQTCNRQVAETHAAWLSSLPATIERDALRKEVFARSCPQLERVFLEYLPLAFSRRHGDPSRPWNRFRIETRDAAGRDLLAFQGNWRDIFQNWEALALSYPQYLESMIAKFVNATTVDGHNPYRISRDGIDWEEPEPDNPWAAYGYWGDHQIIYLLKLLESCAAHFPGTIEAQLGARRFAYANVPYRLKSFEQMLANPRDTILFDHKLSSSLRHRASAEGSDAKLISDAQGQPVLVSLLEKLLVPMLAKWSSFVPGGGIWMNTQRPEWNDANNALAGYGLSVVTLSYLRRHQAWLLKLLAGVSAERHELSRAVVIWLKAVGSILRDARRADGASSPEARLSLMRGLGQAAEAFRTSVYDRAFAEEREVVSHAELLSLIGEFQHWANETLRANLRPDGLYNSYNLLALKGDGVEVRYLDAMLEGQVAILSSGLLSPDETIDLLRRLRASSLYCPRRRSYLLYPDKPIRPFLVKNRIAPAALKSAALLTRMLERGDHRIVCPDGEGQWRFQADLHNEEVLLGRLRAIAAEGIYGTLPSEEIDAVRAVYEGVFNHHAFTGRSGSMFAYEGLGSIYWHMISKLLLAVQENLISARADGAPAKVIEALDQAYEDVRNGLGFRKTAREYGAFPSDPYSHTPAHAGAQQPGMTGQVKEELLTRRVELGVHVRSGSLQFEPVHRLVNAEYLGNASEMRMPSLRGSEVTVSLPSGSFALTVCQVPVVCHKPRAGTTSQVCIHRSGGTVDRIDGSALDQVTSRSLFARDGSIERVEVFL